MRSGAQAQKIVTQQRSIRRLHMTTITEELPLPSSQVLLSTMLDVPALATAFSRRLREAGMPVTTSHAEHYALSLALVKPSSRHALYCTTRAVFVTGQHQLTTFDRVFDEVFSSAHA
jgi:uncharacterized protein with von Willebrand factor type A (vWA) domain